MGAHRRPPILGSDWPYVLTIAVASTVVLLLAVLLLR